MTARFEEKKHLSAKGLLKRIRESFEKVKDPKQGSRNGTIPLEDCLMSALAIFGLKYPSLLQFEKHKNEEIIKHNLKNLYGVNQAPCDTYLRERIDTVDPEEIRPAFSEVFSLLQRGKVLEGYTFIDNHYLLLADGTGFFSSKSVHCKNCCEKKHRNGTVTYSHMMLGATLAHPDHKEVIPLCPEPIAKQDGSVKNDCERNASKRLIAKFRKEHPHLPVILVEDGLSANAVHLRLCQENKMRFITVVKPDGNKTLFSQLEKVPLQEKTMHDEKGTLRHRMRFINKIPFNDADPTLQVNVVEYWAYDKEGCKSYHNTWVTDITITEANVFDIVRGGRARWKVENETFNTLKNQGYNFEHNYGHGKENLSTMFGMLMMLAFLVDQVQQRCCGLFQAALTKLGSKRSLWERIRGAFCWFKIGSWKDLFEGIVYGLVDSRYVPNTS